MAKTAVETWFCDLCNKEFDTMRGRDFHMRRWCPENPDADRPGESNLTYNKTKKATAQAEETNIFGGVSDVQAETAPVDPDGPSIFDEMAPEKPRKWREKLWGTTDGPKIVTPKTVETRPRRRRKSTEGIWQLICGGMGQFLIYSRADVPVGNALTFQAPVVGPIVDKAIAGTVIDTFLQPLAGAGERFEDVADVVSLPGLVFIMERAPQVAPALEPLLRKAIRRHLVEYARMAKAQKKADAEYRKALDDLGMDDVGDDPVDGIMAQIWAGAPVAEEESGGAMNGHAAGAHVEP